MLVEDPSSVGPCRPAESRIHRPWGWYEILAEGPGYRVKRILIHADRRISLQRHRHRCEHWVVVAGAGMLALEDTTTPAEAGTTLFIPCGATHRAAAGSADLILIEVQRGDDLREDDIERLADDFGRLPPQGVAGAGSPEGPDPSRVVGSDLSL